MAIGPRVSIGMPVYNGERFIRAAIESLLEQTYSDFELLISDNASDDATREICLEFAKIDSRVRYSRNDRNLGAAPNYNRVFALSRGTYFKWAAHDDVCAPTFLERCVQILESDASVVLAHTGVSLIGEAGEITNECVESFHLTSLRPSERLLGCLLAGPWTFHPIFGVMRRDALKKTLLIQDYAGSDFVLLACLALAGKCYQLPERLFLRREHEGRGGKATGQKMRYWWNADNDRRFLYFNNWRRLGGYLGAIARADISAKEQAACVLHVTKWCRWFWPHLYRDIGEAAPQLPISFSLKRRGGTGGRK
ncbi:glycosyltransferase family 2 protein [Thiococcus pfennigii]|jgi:glycosyltransferase involved in cell wall biosynthesis|uniref:glycosyltransferase family 2 protein n=1 Tax=Thiococcus pfennigii TaxID=1057 RepID=UPI0019041846|nr:glycosyltransferase [Thiococcus pfennigii]